jgi:hypothetical protein
MELLRVRRIAPSRLPEVLDALKCQDQAAGRMERGETFTDRPPPVSLIDDATEQRLVEGGELGNVRAVQDDAL